MENGRNMGRLRPSDNLVVQCGVCSKIIAVIAEWQGNGYLQRTLLLDPTYSFRPKDGWYEMSQQAVERALAVEAPLQRRQKRFIESVVVTIPTEPDLESCPHVRLRDFVLQQRANCRIYRLPDFYMSYAGLLECVVRCWSCGGRQCLRGDKLEITHLVRARVWKGTLGIGMYHQTTTNGMYRATTIPKYMSFAGYLRTLELAKSIGPTADIDPTIHYFLQTRLQGSFQVAVMNEFSRIGNYPWITELAPSIEYFNSLLDT